MLDGLITTEWSFLPIFHSFRTRFYGLLVLIFLYFVYKGWSKEYFLTWTATQEFTSPALWKNMKWYSLVTITHANTIFQEKSIHKCTLEILSCSWKYDPSKIRFCSHASILFNLCQWQSIRFPEMVKFLSRVYNLKSVTRKKVIHSVYLNVHTHSCQCKLEKCGSRAVTYYNKKGQTQGWQEYKTVSDPQLWNNSSMLKLAGNPWERYSRDPVTEVHNDKA